MINQLNANLEDTIKKLTESRLAHGPTAESEAVLNAAGIYWDEISNEYFSQPEFLFAEYNKFIEKYTTNKEL